MNIIRNFYFCYVRKNYSIVERLTNKSQQPPWKNKSNEASEKTRLYKAWIPFRHRRQRVSSVESSSYPYFSPLRFVSPSALPPTGVFAVVKSVAAESWIIVDPISEVVKTWIPDARHRCNVRHRRYLNILYPAMSAR